MVWGCKNSKDNDTDFSKSRFDGHDHSKFRKRFSEKFSSNSIISSSNKDRVPNLSLKKEMMVDIYWLYVIYLEGSMMGNA